MILWYVLRERETERNGVGGVEDLYIYLVYIHTCMCMCILCVLVNINCNFPIAAL